MSDAPKAQLTEELLSWRIRLARLGAKLTQQQLADKIGVDQPTLSRFERGRDVGTIMLTRIANATGKDLDFFLRTPQPVLGITFKKGDLVIETLTPGALEMLQLIEDYDLVQRLAR